MLGIKNTFLERRQLRIVFGICLFSFIIRLIVSLNINAKAWPDSEAYISIANSLASGQGYKLNADNGFAEYRAPFYPFLLAVVYKFFGNNDLIIQSLQCLLGAVICWLVYAIGKYLFNSIVGLLASIITAIDPFLVYIAGILLTEQLFIFFLVLAIYLLIRSKENLGYTWILGSGIILGLAVLTRPTALIFIPFCGLYILMQWEFQWKKRLIMTATLMVFIFLTICPWTIRNYVKYRELIIISTAAGLNFYLGNNSLAKASDYDATFAAKPDDLESLLSSASTPKAKENVYTRYTINWIKNNPGRFISLYFQKFVNFWRVTPDHVTNIYKSVWVAFLSAAILILLYLLAILGIWKSRHFWRCLIILYFILLSFPLGLSLFVTSPRFRIPLDPILILFSAYTLNSNNSNH